MSIYVERVGKSRQQIHQYQLEINVKHKWIKSQIRISVLILSLSAISPINCGECDQLVTDGHLKKIQSVKACEK